MQEVINIILKYCSVFKDQDKDIDDLLHETIVLIGYYSLNNEIGQKLMTKGESPIIIKLCNLPVNYFKDKRLTDILFPTLIILSTNKTLL